MPETTPQTSFKCPTPPPNDEAILSIVFSFNCVRSVKAAATDWAQLYVITSYSIHYTKLYERGIRSSMI